MNQQRGLTPTHAEGYGICCWNTAKVHVKLNRSHSGCRWRRLRSSWMRAVSSIRPDDYSLHPLHGWGRAAWWPHCHHLSRKALLLWLTSLPEIPAWFWILPHSSETGGIKPRYSQQHQRLHQHQHQQAASPQGQQKFTDIFGVNLWIYQSCSLPSNISLSVSQDSESSMSEDTGLGSEENSSC